MVTRNPFELPDSGRIIGLDVGEKRVGVAVSDSRRTVALSVGNCERNFSEILRFLRAYAEQNGAASVNWCLIVGYPLNMDGTEGAMAQSARDVAGQLEKDLGWKVCMWDERLTSRQAEAAWFEQREGRTKKGNKKDSVGKMDAGAAVLILQGVLDRLKTTD